MFNVGRSAEVGMVLGAQNFGQVSGLNSVDWECGLIKSRIFAGGDDARQCRNHSSVLVVFTLRIMKGPTVLLNN